MDGACQHHAERAYQEGKRGDLSGDRPPSKRPKQEAKGDVAPVAPELPWTAARTDDRADGVFPAGTSFISGFGS
jgi:hypothetical protein